MPSLNWCNFINFWCYFINIWGHVLLTASGAPTDPISSNGGTCSSATLGRGDCASSGSSAGAEKIHLWLACWPTWPSWIVDYLWSVGLRCFSVLWQLLQFVLWTMKNKKALKLVIHVLLSLSQKVRFFTRCFRFQKVHIKTEIVKHSKLSVENIISRRPHMQVKYSVVKCTASFPYLVIFWIAWGGFNVEVCSHC